MEPYAFPLLIKQLLTTPIAQRSRKEIVYRDRLRLSYPELIERIHRLGSALHRMGVGQGSTVAMLDWDSHRYLEFLLRHSDAGRDVDEGEHPVVARAACLHA